MPIATPAQMAGALKAAGFTGTDIVIGVAVGMAESGGRTDATNRNTNGSTDYGVWQINSIHKDALAMGNWSDINANARMAKLVFDQAGHSWRPWVTYNTGSYRKFMSQGMAGAGNPTNVPPSSSVQNVADSSGPLDGITGFFHFITDAHNWLRLGFFAIGMVLLLIGIWQLTGIDAGKVASTAAKAAVLA